MSRPASAVSDQARQTVDGYFADLEAGRFDDAVRWFTDDVVYSHPPYPEEGLDAPRHEVRGRDALRTLFEHRGVRRADHRITTFLTGGSDVMFGGEVFGANGEVALSFVSIGTIEPETGLLATYAAYVSTPPVWAALEEPA